MSIASRTTRAVLCAALAAGGISVFAPPSYATWPGDSPGVITAPAYDANGVLSYQSGSPDGTGIVRWTPDSGAPGGQGLAYSPDGTKIAFYDTAALWVARADGTQAHIIARTGQYTWDARPAWSADGASVYYQDTSMWQQGDCRVVTDEVWADGARARQIDSVPLPHDASGCPEIQTILSTSVDGDLAISLDFSHGVRIRHHSDGSVTPLSFPGLIPADADYSPDGASLVFVGDKSRTNGTQYTDGIYVADLATSATTEIVSYGGDPNLPAGFHDFHTPVWAPDGSAVAYLDDVDDGTVAPQNHLRVYHFGTGTSTELTGFHAAPPLAWRPNTAPLPAPAVPTVDRIGGADRIATAVDASRFEFAAADATTPGVRKATCAVLTRSDSYADALSGSALAGAKSCPLLLTPTAALPGTVVDELKRVLPGGATVYLLGGTDVMSPTVESQVAGAGFTPRRLAGADRYATSLAIAHEVTAHPEMVLVATADNYPDALAAGAVASSRSDAVVLTLPSGGMTADARAYLTSAMADPSAQLVAVGGPGYTSVTGLFSQSQLNAWTDDQRFFNAYGEDRYRTDSQLFMYFGLLSHRTVALATGTNWADALAGGSVAGLNNAQLILTDGTGIPDGVKPYLGPPNSPVAEMLVFGGSDVVPPRAVSALESAIGEQPWTYFENRLAPVLP